MADLRTEKTLASIKGALLALLREKSLQQISVAELARRANISRSTFYSHFENTVQVFESLVIDFLSSTRSLAKHLKCAFCKDGYVDYDPETTPFCVALISNAEMQPLFKDPQFLPTLLNLATYNAIPEALYDYKALGLSEDEAYLLYRFQMTGCYTTAMAFNSLEEWEKMQPLIDRFVEGGRRAAARKGRGAEDAF